MSIYDTEKWALQFALEGNGDAARDTINHLENDELDKFNNALDALAVMVDTEMIRRNSSVQWGARNEQVFRVIPAQVEAAKLLIDLHEEDGEPIEHEEALRAIANAQPEEKQ